MNQQLKSKLKTAVRSLKDYLVKFDEVKEVPSTIGFSKMALSRSSLINELPYKDFDKENNLVFLDQNNEISVGFGFTFNPLLIQGDSAAEGMNSLISKAPVGALLTTMIHSSPVVGYVLDSWERSKNIRKSAMSTKLVEKRKAFIEGGALNYSVSKDSRFHSRNYTHMFFARIPFTGDVGNASEIEEFMAKVLEFKNSVNGNLDTNKLSPIVMKPEDFHFMLWHLLNPQKISEDQRAYSKLMTEPFLNKETNKVEMGDARTKFSNIIHKDTRIKVTSKSNLVFTEMRDGEGEEAPEIEVIPMSVDEYPDFLLPQSAGALIGELVDKDSRISCPFTLYSNIEIVNGEAAIKDVRFKKFLIQKQLVSESDFAKNNFAEMFRRRDDAENFLKESKGKNRPVRMMTGLNLYTVPERRNLDVEEAEGLFKKEGYRVSPESFIGVPVFLSSLPLCYDPKADLPNSGLQRAQMVTSFNAACGSHLSGEWKGSPTNVKLEGGVSNGGGPLMIGPKGQIGAIDIYNSTSNYNGICIGTSGAGKSFFMAEMATDTYCRNGVVRIVDVGRSYYNLAENLGGQNVIFDIQNPISLNPFWGVSSKAEFHKLSEFWRDLLVTMAYPEGRDSDSWEFRFIQEGVLRSWKEHGERLDLPKIVETLIFMNDEFNLKRTENGDEKEERGLDVIYQLSPFSDPDGSFYPWFVGPCQLEMNNDFMVFELDELSGSNELKNIILMMITNQIERELYLSDRARWRLTIIDEAYDLLRDPRVGKVIEYLFRKARKYKGSCIVGTQTFEDMYDNKSTIGILGNSGWKFILKQDPASTEKAFEKNVVTRSPFMEQIISGIKPGSDFGEVFIRSPEKFDTIYRLVTDPYSYFTYSSKDMPTVQKIAKEKQAQNPTLEWNYAIIEAIEQLANEMMEKKIGA